jgi:hypothetical protein
VYQPLRAKGRRCAGPAKPETGPSSHGRHPFSLWWHQMSDTASASVPPTVASSVHNTGTDSVPRSEGRSACQRYKTRLDQSLAQVWTPPARARQHPDTPGTVTTAFRAAGSAPPSANVTRAASEDCTLEAQHARELQAYRAQRHAPWRNSSRSSRSRASRDKSCDTGIPNQTNTSARHTQQIARLATHRQRQLIRRLSLQARSD